MRIISKFHDYYDTARGYGIDPKLVYVRERREISINYGDNTEDIRQSKLLSMYLPPACSFMSRGVIGFCGKAYPFYLAVETDPDRPMARIWKVFYSLDKAIAHFSVGFRDTFNRRRTFLNSLEDKGAWNRSLTKLSWKKFQVERKVDIKDDIFLYFKSPVVVLNDSYSKEELVVNPILREYQFASVVDPFQAFQELSMYVGNNLVSQMDPDVNISDDLKRDSKGFDKWSFRRHKDDSKKGK